MEFAIGAKSAGKVTFELYSDMTPKTAENFRGLCTGEYGIGTTSKAKLHYLGNKIHRVVSGFCI